MLDPADTNRGQGVLRRRGPSEQSPLERVARLRDELHVTAIRIARFTVDEHPVVEPARIKAPTAATATLGAGQLLFQLRLAADRLVDLLVQVTPQAWLHVGRVGDRPMTLHDLVDDMLVAWTNDFLDPQEAARAFQENGAAPFLERPRVRRLAAATAPSQTTPEEALPDAVSR